MSHFARRVGVTNRQETLGLLATAERRAQLTPINSVPKRCLLQSSSIARQDASRDKSGIESTLSCSIIEMAEKIVPSRKGFVWDDRIH